MPFLKSISGHTACSLATQRYLEYGGGKEGVQAYVEKRGRAIGHDFLNLSADEQGRWAEVMDETREAHGNNRSWQGSRAVTYRHFIVSPSPEDHVSLETLRNLAVSWVEANFSSYQVAITYHDDNAGRIPHAHIIVNNTNLDTGRRLHFSARETRAIADNLQTLAMERGLRHFANVEGEETRPELVHPLAEIIRNRAAVNRRYLDRRPSAQREIISKSEREAAARGVKLWKAEIRDKVLAAMWLSDGTEESFARELCRLGVLVDLREKDILYTDASMPTHKVTSTRLGTDFGREGLARIATVAALKLDLNEEGRGNLRSKISEVEVIDMGIGVEEVSARRQAAGISLRQIDDALELLASSGIRSIYEGKRTVAKSPDSPFGKSLAEALEVARAIGFIPYATANEAEYLAKVKEKRAAEAAAPLEVKIRKGYRLSKEEYASLTPKQRAAWEVARRAGTPTKGKSHHSNTTVEDDYIRGSSPSAPAQSRGISL